MKWEQFRWRDWARRMKAESLALYYAARDPRTPCYAKLIGASVAAYALSPLDLIPDFIPILGCLDDLLLVPAGIALAVRLIPGDVLAECRQKARDAMAGPASRTAAAVILAVWLILLGLAVAWVLQVLR